MGIKDACEGGSSLPYFITQEYKNNVGYLVGRIVLTSRPDAIDDFYSTKTNAPLTVAAPGVLGNDFDVDGDDLDVVSHTDPAHGEVTIDSETGAMTYTQIQTSAAQIPSPTPLRMRTTNPIPPR